MVVFPDPKKPARRMVGIGLESDEEGLVEKSADGRMTVRR